MLHQKKTKLKYDSSQIGKQVVSLKTFRLSKNQMPTNKLTNPHHHKREKKTQVGKIATKIKFHLTKIVYLIPDEPLICHELAQNQRQKRASHMKFLN